MIMLTVGHRKGPHGLIVIVTDTNLVGKYFSEGNRQLDLRGAFYKGEELDLARVEVVMKSATILHLTGEKTVALAQTLGVVGEGDRKLVVQGVVHMEVVRE